MTDDLFIRIGRNLDQDWAEAQKFFVDSFQTAAQLTVMCDPRNRTEFLKLLNSSPSHLFAVQQFCGLGLREAEYRRQMAIRDSERDE